MSYFSERNLARIKADESEDSEIEEEFIRRQKQEKPQGSSKSKPKKISKGPLNNKARVPENQALVDALEARSKLEDKNGEAGKARAWANGAKIIAEQKAHIIESSQVRDIYGIGPSISRFIDAFEPPEPQLSSKEDKEYRYAVKFSKVKGITLAKGRELYRAGYRTFQDIAEDPEDIVRRKDAQRSAPFAEEISQRIPRAIMLEIQEQIAVRFEGKLAMWAITGSFRRGNPDSGDIDLIVRADSDDILPSKVAKYLGDYFLVKFTGDTRKWIGAARFKDGIAHQIDIRVFTPEEWSYGLRYNTGSDQFNKLIYQRAKDLGYKMNEYEMIDLRTKRKFPAKSERDIFNYLGIKFVPASKRGPEMTELEIV